MIKVQGKMKQYTGNTNRPILFIAFIYFCSILLIYLCLQNKDGAFDNNSSVFLVYIKL